MITNATSGTNVHEIAAGIYRINTPIVFPDGAGAFNFNQYLIVDDESLVFHTGPRRMFPLVSEAVGKILPLDKLSYIAFSHFEADECGSLNEWQGIAPMATPVCSFVGKVVSVDDFVSGNPARAMADGEILETGTKRFRFLATPQVPHCWEAGLMFEENGGVLFCSDLFHQNGEVEPMTESDVVGRARETITEYQQGPLANYLPYTSYTDSTLKRLASLKPKVLATMHGSVFQGDGEKAMLDYADMVKQVLGS
jgi:flavorubredoxin